MKFKDIYSEDKLSDVKNSIVNLHNANMYQRGEYKVERKHIDIPDFPNPIKPITEAEKLFNYYDDETFSHLDSPEKTIAKHLKFFQTKGFTFIPDKTKHPKKTKDGETHHFLFLFTVKGGKERTRKMTATVSFLDSDYNDRNTNRDYSVSYRFERE